ncbi:MAG TPA: response regulator transcription factor [Candidatus Sulfotelmatobacter sp.]
MDRILIMEDDPAAQKALNRLFVAEGFSVEIQPDGERALDSFHAAVPSVIVLDLRVPKLFGKDLCREIKAEVPSVPIIVVSDSDNISDKVLLLGLGADDYLTKPFNPRELLARVHAALRHAWRVDTRNWASFDGVVVDFKKVEVTRDSRPVVLTACEFKTLRFLIQNADFVFTRAELLKNVWGYQGSVQTRTVDTHILKLRQKLERDPHRPIHILTVHSMGYKFVR